MFIKRVSVEEKEKDEDELFFRAEKFTRQFEALRYHLNLDTLKQEIQDNYYFNRLKKSKSFNGNEVKRWLFNGWNTERILHLNKELFKDKTNAFALQWAFPQAYYSTFGLTLAYFETVGHQQKTHTAVMKQFAKLITEDKYPNSISYYVDGHQKSYSYNNIQKHIGYGPFKLHYNDPKCLEHWVAEFLASTRSYQLEDNKFNIKIYNKNGKTRKSYRKEEWEQVSKSTGPTTIMNILYRKRIKGNYDEIDVFQYEEFRCKEIYNSLMYIVYSLNLIHESYIHKAMGNKDYMKFYDEFNKSNKCTFLEKRLEYYKS